MEKEASLKQPKGLYLLSFLASFERFGFYGITPLLVLYMINSVNSNIGGIGLDAKYAGPIFHVFIGMCYLFPLLGGWISDSFIGQRKSVMMGAVLITAGMFICGMNSSLAVLLSGLMVIALGNGFFKPTHISMIGELYEQGDKRRDSAFTLYYMIFNVSAIAAPIVCSILAYKYGYRYGFFLSGAMMLLGVILYSLFSKKLLGNIGLTAKNKTVYDGNKIVERAPLTKEDKDRITVIFVVLFFVTFFFAGFFQAPSSITLFTENFINRTIPHLGIGHWALNNWTIPTEWFQSINPIFVVLLSPVFSGLWFWLSKRNRNPSTPKKMSAGMIFLGLGFLFMVGAFFQRGGNNPNVLVKASLLWILATYLFHTIGELCLSPIGLSMITKLAPARMTSIFMACWFLSFFVASLLGAVIFGFVNSLGVGQVFPIFAGFCVVLGIIVFAISKKLVAMMHGRD